MTLNKKQLRAIITVAVIFAVYNVLAFVIPFKHTNVFWTGWAFGLISLIVSLLIFLIAFGKAEDAKSRFYGFPIARVACIYVTAQLAVSVLAMILAFIDGMPAWPFVLVSVLLLAAAVLGTVATDSVRDEIERQDTSLKANVDAVRELRSLGSSLVSQCEDDAVKAELKKLSDALNFCDPVSNAATAEAEGELKAVLGEIQRALVDGDTASVSPLCKKAAAVLAERNRLCKLNKN